MAATGAAADRPAHRRNKSSSVLKSIIAPKSHKRSPSDGTALSKNQSDNRPHNPVDSLAQGALLLPPDQPHSQQRSANRDQNIPTNPPSPRKSHDLKGSPTKSLHKKTLSSVSLRSLGREKDKVKEKQSREPSRVRDEAAIPTKPKRPKSTTNLVGMFSKSKQPKEAKSTSGRDKENTTPPSSASAAGPVQTPIWAQFSSQAPLQEVTTTSKIPLNDRRSLEEEMSRYTPQDYSPSKQRNFFDYGVPSLQTRPQVKERPKSSFLPTSNSTASLFDQLSRKKSNDRAPLSDTKGNEGRTRESASSKSVSARGPLECTKSDDSKKKDDVKPQSNTTKRTNRVMAAVAALNGKTKRTDPSGTSPVKLDPKVVDAEFEVVLVSR